MFLPRLSIYFNIYFIWTEGMVLECPHCEALSLFSYKSGLEDGEDKPSPIAAIKIVILLLLIQSEEN